MFANKNQLKEINGSILFLTSFLLFCLPTLVNGTSEDTKTFKIIVDDPPGSTFPKTNFQDGGAWEPRIDNRADAVMIYGFDGSFDYKLNSWQSKGYIPQFMTGVAWGNYQDYFNGGFDGVEHDIAQVEVNGNKLMHSGSIPYVVPTESYVNYLKSLVKEVIDHDIDDIFLEEPELWTNSGYSQAFKEAWENFYGNNWIGQHTSPDAAYKSAKLKLKLYKSAIKEIFKYAKEYGNSLGRNIKCYIATHSLLSYSYIRMVSPEAELNDIEELDGIIGQVWSGTSRAPNYYDGNLKSRTFENAYLEYGSVFGMSEPTDLITYFLTDPLEDNPDRTWEDYKNDYEATFTAQLLFPDVDHYEVMPWAGRVYTSEHQNVKEGKSTTIPYPTQMQVMIDALKKMPKSRNTINGSQGISVLMSNSLMFQRLANFTDDNYLSDFYGLALPLVINGVPIKVKVAENLGYENYLDDTKILIMTFSNMKPTSEMVTTELAKWVRSGGTLVFVDKNNDPYQNIEEWWNSGAFSFSGPAAALFNEMGMPSNPLEGSYTYGNGSVYVIQQRPQELIKKANGDETYIAVLKSIYQNKLGKELEIKNNFLLKRGKYFIGAVFDKLDTGDTTSLTIKGPVIDLFDPSLPVLEEKKVEPGKQTFLLDYGEIEDFSEPQVLASASEVSEIEKSETTFKFMTKAPLKTDNSLRLLLPSKPTGIKVLDGSGQPVLFDAEWDSQYSSLHIQFANNPNGRRVEIQFEALNCDGLEDMKTPIGEVGERTNSLLTFHWDKVDGAVGYNVSLDNGLTWVVPTSGFSGTTHSINNLNSNQEVTLLIKAIGLSCGLETISLPVVGKTLDQADEGVGNERVFIPNVFTPNGDGKNDFWRFYGDQINKLKVEIFNKMGKKIAEIKSPNGRWGGKYKGDLVPNGVYVYQALIEYSDGKRELRNGTITLLR